MDERILSVLSEKIAEGFDQTLSAFNQRLSNLEQTIAQNTSRIEDQDATITDLRSENASLESRLQSFESKFESAGVQSQSDDFDVNLHKKVHDLEEEIEERTNRSLRQTLVIKGIPEIKNGKEKWSDTWQLLAETISKTINISYDDSYDMFNRVHRSPPSDHPQMKNKRPIYATLHDWDDCEYLVDKFCKANATNKNLNVYYVDYKYGKLTTIRRNEALKRRKELKLSKQLVSVYIAYPARLMVKKTTDSKYEELEDFSKLSVPVPKPEDKEEAEG